MAKLIGLGCLIGLFYSIVFFVGFGGGIWYRNYRHRQAALHGSCQLNTATTNR